MEVIVKFGPSGAEGVDGWLVLGEAVGEKGRVGEGRGGKGGVWVGVRGGGERRGRKMIASSCHNGHITGCY